MISVGVVGASGYTGLELMRLITGHPDMELKLATAHKYKDHRIDSLYPSLSGYLTGSFREYDPQAISTECDAVFLGLPHGESMGILPEIARMGKKVVDLSADFRFHDPEVYSSWYGVEHPEPGLLARAVYGLPEINRSEIAGADIVANPGCYPTGVILGMAPLVKGGLVRRAVTVDAKSGVSGAGRKLTLPTHYPQIADGIAPYAVSGHRHLPEMELALGRLSGGDKVQVVFVPHLTAMNRGILCTMYAELSGDCSRDDIESAYEEEYGDEPFVNLLPRGKYPETKSVLGSNNCHIGLELAGEKMIVVMTAIDNLVKGASGQAIQNMNITCGIPEQAGLSAPGLFP